MVFKNKRSAWIKGYEGLYKIFSDGTIISYKQDKINGRVLTHKISGSNKKYCMVDLTMNGVHDDRYVHKLLAEVFVVNPHPRKYKYVIHNDGDSQNNSLSNLSWTDSAGRSEKKQINRKKRLKENDMFSSKLSNDDVDIIAHFFVNKKKERTLSQLHKMFNVSNMTIHRLRKTKRYRDAVSKLEKM